MGEHRTCSSHSHILQNPINIDATSFHRRLALLQTCSQTRQEASGIFYAENAFEIVIKPDGNEPFAAWLDLIGERNVRLVKRLVVVLDYSAETDERVRAQIKAQPYSALSVSTAWHLYAGIPLVRLAGQIKTRTPRPFSVAIKGRSGEGRIAGKLVPRLCEIFRQLLNVRVSSEKEMLGVLPWAKWLGPV